MYTLAVEIHGLRQLERLQPELIADIRRRAISVMEVQGAKFSVQQGGLWVFRFERAQPDDREGVLEALAQTTSLLTGRENELAGWGVYLEFIEGAATDAARVVREALHPVYEDNVVWLGQTAYTLLGGFVDAEAAGPAGTLYRLNGRLGVGAEEVGSALEFARTEASVDAILDGLVPDDLVGGMLMIVGDDPLALRVNVRVALERFVGTSPAVRWLEAEPDGHDDYGPLLSTFTALDMHETPFWLDEAARASWEERAPLVAAELARDVSSILPDSYDVDLLIAFEGYLAAFVRRAAASIIPPVLVCHDIDRWSALALEALARTVGRMPVPDGEPALMLIATASRAPGSASIAPLVRATIRLPRPTLADLRAAGVGDVNSERLMRLTHGHAAATIHYLAESRYWDGVTDAALEDVTESDIAWRVVAGLDSEVQEMLLAAHYGASFVSRDQFIDICVVLGADRVRVPAVLSRLRLLGLIVDRERVVPSHPDHKGRLEAALGRASTTVYERVAGAVIELVDAGRVEVTERLLETVSKLSEGDYLPRLYHGLLTRVMSRRRIEEAQRLLFDAVPPRGFHPRSRGCMQAVVSANRLRLALLQGNMQAAERTKSASDRISDGERCDFAAGDLAVQKARLSFQNGPTKETVALLKRAIMIYQDLDDQAGLARANLDFGLVLLGQEDILGAREYFLLAGKSAASDDDSFEQIRARVYTLVCEYVYGNLTRMLAQADDLDGRARAAGMREIQLFAELARGRALFELGRYEEAGDVFSRGRSRARLYGFALPGAVMQRWLARSLVYDGRVRRGLSVLRDQSGDPESCFFLAEALLRTGDHAEAIAELDRGLKASAPPRPSVEGIAWSSGFASLEDRAVGVSSGTRVLLHQMMALRGFLLAESGRTADGVEEMHRLTRELRISEIDPYNRVYFYLYSLILPESGELNVEDGTTVLGKAVRYIQQRTSRMDDYAHKTDFLRRNYWNARLMSHAQTHNLV